MENNSPSSIANIASSRLLLISKLNGYYKIDYYTGEIIVNGVYLPNGLCVCSKFKQTINEYEQFDSEWNCFSEYNQRMILLEVGDKYCNNELNMKNISDNDWNHLHDCILDLTWNTSEKSCSREELIKIFEKLPFNLKYEATEWGMSDTLWRDKFREWYKLNY